MIFPSISIRVRAHHVFVVGLYRNEFGDMKKPNRKISITFDEWTSTRNRRYMNVNAHASQRTWNLGLKRIVGSMNAEKYVPLSEDVVTARTDGASLMKKVGKLISADHNVCLAHGIRLTVTRVLYTRSKSVNDMRELNQEGLYHSLTFTSQRCNVFSYSRFQ